MTLLKARPPAELSFFCRAGLRSGSVLKQLPDLTPVSANASHGMTRLRSSVIPWLRFSKPPTYFRFFAEFSGRHQDSLRSAQFRFSKWAAPFCPAVTSPNGRVSDVTARRTGLNTSVLRCFGVQDIGRARRSSQTTIDVTRLFDCAVFLCH